MKLKFTPLSIVAALCLSFALFIFFFKDQHGEINGAMALLFGGLAIAAFVVDLISRVIIKDLKLLWIIQTVFIFAAVIYFFGRMAFAGAPDHATFR